MERVTLNVGGTKYETYVDTLRAHPQTLLGGMFQGHNNREHRHQHSGNEYFFDRNGRAFHHIIQWYRTGVLVWPDLSVKEGMGITLKEVEDEVAYFRIPVGSPRAPAARTYQKAVNAVNQFIDRLVAVIEAMLEHCEYDATITFSFAGLVEVEDTSAALQQDIGRILEPVGTAGVRFLEQYHLDIDIYLTQNVPHLKCQWTAESSGNFVVKLFIESDSVQRYVTEHSYFSTCAEPDNDS